MTTTDQKKWAMETVSSLVLLCSTFLFLAYFLRSRQKDTIAFMHFNYDIGGGGERVLYTIIKGIQEQEPTKRIIIYTHSRPVLVAQFYDKIEGQFGLGLQHNIEFVPIRLWWMSDAATWTRCTLLGQALGSFIAAIEAVLRHPPKVFVDTSGHAFAFPVARMAGCRVVCYVHYHTISLDM